MKSRRLLLLLIPAGVLLWAVFFAAHLLQAHKKARGAELFIIHESIALYLEEARPHRVSFFTKDRLVSSDAKPPHWEASGEPATR
jgi:hypothetical protein